jgi:hypothetical protein
MGRLSPEEQRAAALVDRFCAALDLEIEAERKWGGKGYLITDGRLVCEHQGWADYLFLLEAEVTVPDGSPVRVELDDLTIEGHLVSKDGNEVLLQLDANIGDQVSQATMYCEPWRLLQALQQRLRDLAACCWGNPSLAMAVLEGHGPSPPGATTGAPFGGAAGPGHRPAAGGNGSGTRFVPRDGSAGTRRTGQEVAFKRAMEEEVLFIWGPPGTGKTHLLGRLAASMLCQGRRVLILSHSNVAVDGAVYRTLGFLRDADARGKVVRYGWARLPEVRDHPFLLSSRLAEDLRPGVGRRLREAQEQRRRLRERLETDRWVGPQLRAIDEELKRLREQLREAEQQVARNARVLGTTLSKAVVDKAVFEQEFDTVLVDEVSMAYVPQVFFAAGVARKSVAVLGDFRQLPPIALSEAPLVERWLKTDIFEHVGITKAVDEGGPHPRLVMLEVQSRMHPAISAFPSAHVYGCRLDDAPNMHEERAPIVAAPPFPGDAVVLLDVSGLGCFCHQDATARRASTSSRYNPLSALVATWVAGQAIEGGSLSLGVIAPYSTHARLLLAVLRDLYPKALAASPHLETPCAATVHRFQGSERDIMVFDYVDAYPMKAPGAPLCNQKGDQARRLLNVAITRARGKLVVVADTAYILGRVGNHSIHRAFLTYLNKNARTLRGNELVSRLLRTRVGEHGSLTWHDPREGQSRLLDDLARAQETVRLSLPSNHSHDFSPGVLEALVEASRREVRVVVECSTGDWSGRGVFPPGFEPTLVANNYVWTPTLAVDDKIVWLAAPIWETPPGDFGLLCRLGGQRCVSLLSTLLFKDRGEPANRHPGSPLRKGLARFVRDKGLACPNCGRFMRPVTSRQGRVFLGCSGYPACSYTAPLDRQVLEAYVLEQKVPCPVCGGPAVVRHGRTGLFLGCNRYPSCNGVLDLRRLL